MRETLPENSFATQTAFRANARSEGPSPTGIVAVTMRRRGSMRETVPSRLFATQIDPAPAITSLGPPPT